VTITPGALLLVDDNDDNRYTLTRRLQREGYDNLTTANDGQQALELLQARPFDLVLLDVMMPGLNGYDVLERMRADTRLRHIPVIMISALDEIDSVIRCIELGAEDYLAKPFNPTLLRARVGASLEKKRLRDEVLVHVQRMERELDTARAIQLSMVPSEFPESGVDQPLTAYGVLQSAREIGGDLYDCFWIAPERLCLIVADVSDKGASAALHMARTKTAIRFVAKLLEQNAGRAPGAADIVAGINEELCQDNPHAMFVTFLLCIVDARTGDLEWCNAGHTAPYLVASPGSVNALAQPRGFAVGIRNKSRFPAGTARIVPGGSLFLYTDGITEAVNEQGELFGEERLEAALQHCANREPREFVHAVLAELRSFVGTAPPADDIAALACRWRA
jgi:sigma-B regulation protein RsbU (phosphoserine phosphatase)